MKQIDKFIMSLTKLEVQEFIGLARLLHVKLYEETNPDAEQVKDKYEPRDFAAVCNDMIINFANENRKRRREIMKLIEAALSDEEAPHDKA